jgi:hypothetical protein
MCPFGSDPEDQAMKLATLAIPVLALSLVGCGTETVKETKETVVEKPTAARETVVVPPQVTKETIVQPLPALRSCTYLSTTYSDGSLSCQNGYLFRCDDGSWLGRGDSC